ncbi:MAG TPA: nucleotidyltransferase domain-containing protein [Flavobacteriaceae bacterium]|nr:nucleotidyltransferase domain-containing protein [Flavobacteriaceae bacterium]
MDAKTNKIIIDYLKQYDPNEIGVFGSYARGEMTPESDIDILYSLNKTIDLFQLVGIKLDLEEKLNRKIDFVSKHALNRHVKPYILKDLKIIYPK